MHFAHGENHEAAHPHNSVLQLAVEWGLPATALILAAACTAVRRSWRGMAAPRIDADVRVMLVLGMLATLAGMLDSLVSGTLVMPVSQIWWCVALGVMLAAQPVGSSSSGRFVRWRPAAAAVLVIAHLTLSWVTYQHATRPPQDSGAAKHNNMPRYWINGFC